MRSYRTFPFAEPDWFVWLACDGEVSVMGWTMLLKLCGQQILAGWKKTPRRGR